MHLNTGIHTLKVIVRLKGPGVIKCQLKVRLSKNLNIEFHSAKMFKPDLVDGNIFSEYFSIPITNLDLRRDYQIKKVEVVSHSIPGLEKIDIVAFENQIVKTGQISSINFKIANLKSQQKQQKCTKSAMYIMLKMLPKTSDFKNNEVTIELRCRSSAQSFLFTFLDHDGSIQHAAAVVPLKKCLIDKCPVVLTNHGTGIYHIFLLYKRFILSIEVKTL